MLIQKLKFLMKGTATYLLSLIFIDDYFHFQNLFLSICLTNEQTENELTSQKLRFHLIFFFYER